MTEAPRFGQRAPDNSRATCTRHANVPAVAYCKRCNRPACSDCAIPTEVGSICVDCAQQSGTPSQFGTQRQYGRSPWSGQAASSGRRGGLSMSLFSKAPVTTSLIGINVLVFLLEWLLGGRSGPIYQYLVFTPVHGYVQPWRLITTTFLHAGIMHLVFNMLMLFLVGAAVEQALGWWRYLSVYLLSAFGGTIGVIAWAFAQPESLLTATVGASGALYGLFGALFIVQRRAGMSTRSILILLGINLIYSFVVSGVSWQAHIGGFVAGMLVTLGLMWVVDTTRGKSAKAQTTVSLAAIAVMTALLVALTWVLYWGLSS